MAKKNMERALAAKRTTLERQNMIGPKMNFAAAEAYKLLRTNVMFSFPDANENRILGVTSSFQGEGKSLTSINLAYTFAEAGKRNQTARRASGASKKTRKRRYRDGYDGYYDDVLPQDDGGVRQGIDSELAKKIAILIAGVLLIVGVCVAVMYYV